MFPLFSYLNISSNWICMFCALVLFLSCFEPSIYYEWVYVRSANINFYYAANILIAACQIIFIGLLVNKKVIYEYKLYCSKDKKD